MKQIPLHGPRIVSYGERNDRAVYGQRLYREIAANLKNGGITSLRERHEGDNPPVGIILCASKNENLVRYATSGLSQQVFISKYLIYLPSEDELAKIIEEEQRKSG